MRAALLCLLIGTAASAALYQRPINQDCVSSAPASSAVNYFPDQYQVQGLSGNTVTNSEDLVTVCSQAVLLLCSYSPPADRHGFWLQVSFAQGFSVSYNTTYKVPWWRRFFSQFAQRGALQHILRFAGGDQ